LGRVPDGVNGWQTTSQIPFELSTESDQDYTESDQDYKKTTVLYGEHKLQTTLRIPFESSIGSAQDYGMKVMRKLLDKLEAKGMPHIELDPECTDFFPALSPDIRTVGSNRCNLVVMMFYDEFSS